MATGPSTIFCVLLRISLTFLPKMDFQTTVCTKRVYTFFVFMYNTFDSVHRLFDWRVWRRLLLGTRTCVLIETLSWCQILSRHYLSLTSPSFMDCFFQSLQIQMRFRQIIRLGIQRLSIGKCLKVNKLFDPSGSQLKMQRDSCRQVFQKPSSEHDTNIWIQNVAEAQRWALRYVKFHSVFSWMINKCI